MTAVETYLSRLRSELVAAGAPDADDLVAEIRSLLADAAGNDPDGAVAAIARLGEPGELAQGILAERGLDASSGISSGVWWRLGVAAPIDIAIGLALPLAAAVPLYIVGRFGEPRAASVALALALGAVALAWPLYIWRPYQRGGRTLSPGMTLTGLAVVRAPGFWRLVPLSELAATGLAPRRRVVPAVLTALVAVVMLAGFGVEGVGLGSSWVASLATTAETTDRAPSREQLQSVVEGVYIALWDAQEAGTSTAIQHVAPEALRELAPLRRRIADRGIRQVDAAAPTRVAPGVYRVEVTESREDPSLQSERVGSSTFTLGLRRWQKPGGSASDWVVVGIELGE